VSAPEEEELFVAAVNLLMASEKWEEAVALITPRLSEAPLGHEVLWKLGWSHLQLGQHSEAATHLRDAIESGPVSAVYYGSLGMALLHLEEHDAAELWLLRALAIHDSHLTRRSLALAYQKRGLWDVAEAVHKEGIRLRSDDSERLHAYADFLEDGGREEDAANVRRVAESV
jgi:tetratricopeptide (TPR) repeat protein